MKKRKRNATLIASAKKGTHEVLIYRRKGYIKRCVFARVRKETFEDPSSPKSFLSAVFRIAHHALEMNKRIDESEIKPPKKVKSWMHKPFQKTNWFRQ